MAPTLKQELIDGLKDSIPVFAAVVFFGLLFGATGVNNGLDFWQTMGASAFIFAGASQFAFLELYNLKVPVWSILLAVFAVNFRFVLYSAALSRHVRAYSFFQKFSVFYFLTDLVFAIGENRANSTRVSAAYLISFCVIHYIYWMIATAVGALMGNLIADPNALGMDMLLPIYFLVLLMGFRSRPNWLTCVLVSGIVSVLLYETIGSPWHISLGGLSGILAAALITKPEKEEAIHD